MTRTIDLNCDMGEGFGPYRLGDDAAMLALVTSANIACGFHAGDPVVIRNTLRLARARGAAVGAHPSFLDLYGFGRRRISGESPEDLEAQLIYQIGAVEALARAEGWPITHVKTHGALANMAAEDAVLAGVCARAAKAVDPGLTMVVPPYSEAMRAAEAEGLAVACEIYADRAYTDAGALMPRSRPGAVIHDPAASLKQVLHMVVDGFIPTESGKRLPVEAASLCIHGDTPGAVEIATRLREGLEREGVSVRPFRLPPAG